ncbi:MAG: MBL fold metallo-hydrolase [Polyangiaceae bacterium]
MNLQKHHGFAVALLLSAAACTPESPPPTPSDTAASAATATASASAAAPSASVTAAPTTSAASTAPTERPGPEVIATSAGDLTITPIYHGTVMLQHGGKTIIVDPWSKATNVRLPKADLLLITDIHEDHFDKAAIERVKKDSTVIVAPAVVAKELPGAKVLKNGDRTTIEGFAIEAIPMYNKVRGPETGKLYHDKGRGNGYVVTFGDKRVYLSGDTECTDEMKALKNIDVAFVCMNLPYTMPPAEAAECIRAFKPKVVYPYHYKDSNLTDLTKAMEGETAVEIRLRNWY